MARAARLTAAALGILLLAGSSAWAGIADSPLPVLVMGKTTLHLYSVPGIVDDSVMRTFFSCTSTDTAPMQAGVEVFGAAGGGATNDAAATSLTVNPGATVVFGTSAAVWLTVDSNVTSPLGHGSARILATSKKLACTVFAADAVNDPPTSTYQLTIIAKVKQKAAN